MDNFKKWVKGLSYVTAIAWILVLAIPYLAGRKAHCEATGGQIVNWECVK